MFHFRLHPTQWQFEGDATQIFRALELSDGTYMVSWKTKHDTMEVHFNSEEVTHEMALGHWIITDENGE